MTKLQVVGSLAVCGRRSLMANKEKGLSIQGKRKLVSGVFMTAIEPGRTANIREQISGIVIILNHKSQSHQQQTLRQTQTVSCKRKHSKIRDIPST